MGNYSIPKKVRHAFLLIIFGNYEVFATNGTIEQLKIGNLALPTSQQPGPLIGFGQNIVDKGDLQVFSYVDYLKGCFTKNTEIIPTLLYGFTNNLSLFIQVPIAAKFQQDNVISRGVEELLLQLEYALYEKDTETASNQITLVSNINLTTLDSKNIKRSLGITNFFLGFTASHMAHDWYPFIAAAAMITTKDDATTKYGNQIFYECGISKNLWYESDQYILTGMLELDGVYKQKDRICGVCDPNSGSNTIFLGPSLWFSSQRLILQAGISWVIFEHSSGIPNKNKYYAAIDCGWKF